MNNFSNMGDFKNNNSDSNKQKTRRAKSPLEMIFTFEMLKLYNEMVISPYPISDEGPLPISCSPITHDYFAKTFKPLLVVGTHKTATKGSCRGAQKNP